MVIRPVLDHQPRPNKVKAVDLHVPMNDQVIISSYENRAATGEELFECGFQLDKVSLVTGDSYLALMSEA